jgi:hypothetical protein
LYVGGQPINGKAIEEVTNERQPYRVFETERDYREHAKRASWAGASDASGTGTLDLISGAGSRL